jgi:hypothetical protein
MLVAKFFVSLKKDYSCENFSPGKEEFLQELRKLGLVFMKTVRRRSIKNYHNLANFNRFEFLIWSEK